MKTKLFCSICASSLDKDVLEGKERQLCRKCGEIFYENPLPAAAVILVNQKREILLVKREREPSKGMWCLPIGFAEIGESIEDAALRELKEEAGVDGKVIQLIDVISEYNAFYGDILVVIFEVEKTGGEEIAGDDAIDCQYFPIRSLPKLAFDSQEMAVRKFIELKKDFWSMRDSFDAFIEGTMENKIVHPGNLLSDELVNVVQNNSKKIIDLWLDDLSLSPSTKSYRGFDKNELFSRAIFIISQLETWLKGSRSESEFKAFYQDLGFKRQKDGIPLEDLISSLSLLKKHIWMFTYAFGVWDKMVDIYRMFELGERLVYFFDKATFYTVVGYNSKGQGDE
jgi:ADP-ribose pyrophosphatase YjhB (NUDIX family)